MWRGLQRLRSPRLHFCPAWVRPPATAALQASRGLRKRLLARPGPVGASPIVPSDWGWGMVGGVNGGWCDKSRHKIAGAPQAWAGPPSRVQLGKLGGKDTGAALPTERPSHSITGFLEICTEPSASGRGGAEPLYGGARGDNPIPPSCTCNPLDMFNAPFCR